MSTLKAPWGYKCELQKLLRQAGRKLRLRWDVQRASRAPPAPPSFSIRTVFPQSELGLAPGTPCGQDGACLASESLARSRYTECLCRIGVAAWRGPGSGLPISGHQSFVIALAPHPGRGGAGVGNSRLPLGREKANCHLAIGPIINLFPVIHPLFVLGLLRFLKMKTECPEK